MKTNSFWSLLAYNIGNNLKISICFIFYNTVKKCVMKNTSMLTIVKLFTKTTLVGIKTRFIENKYNVTLTLMCFREYVLKPWKLDKTFILNQLGSTPRIVLQCLFILRHYNIYVHVTIFKIRRLTTNNSRHVLSKVFCVLCLLYIGSNGKDCVCAR